MNERYEKPGTHLSFGYVSCPMYQEVETCLNFVLPHAQIYCWQPATEPTAN